MNKEQLIDNICELVNKRNSGEFHIKADVAVSMISDYIDQYTETALKKLKSEILNIINKGTPNRGRTHKKWEQKIIKLCGGENGAI